MSAFLGKRVLVTGAAGLIGSHVVEELLNRGAQVVGTLHRQPASLCDPRVEYRRVDLTRPEDCAAAVRGCEMAVLAAAETSGARVMKDNPVAHVTANLLLNAQLLEASWRAGLDRVLYISSTSVYPVLEHPRREDEAFLGDPHPAYFGVGWMKRYVEKLCAFYAGAYGMNIALVRPTNVYGPRDKFDLERSHVLPALIRKALEGTGMLEVWGTGDTARDFIYVTDLVEALLAVLEHHADGRPFNIGSGRSVTLRDAVGLILKATGKTGMRVQYEPSKPTTIPIQSIDTSDARQILGFAPRISLEEGLKRTVAWYEEYRAIYPMGH